MNDSTQYHFEGKTPGQKSKFPLVLLIVAVILGLVIWRFKNASKPAETAVAPKDTVALTAPAPDTVKHDTVDMTPPAVVLPKPEAAIHVPVAKPVHAPKRHKAQVEAPTSEPAVTTVPEPKPEPKPKPVKPAKVMEEPKVAAPAPTSEPQAASTAQPAKKFALEDQSMPEKSVISEEGKIAMTTVPKAGAPSEVAAASPAASDAFKQGSEAYHKQDYAAAIQLLGQLPKPATKQRGNPARDEYVEGNFLLGLSYLRADRANDAVNSFLTVLNYEKYYPLANMNLGICYVELKQYFKANKAFEAVVRDQGYVDASIYDDVMQRTKYFWAIAWTRMYKTSKDADKQAFYQQQAIQRWKDYQTWFGKNTKYRAENRKADDYIKSLSAM